ncbi:MAG: Fis family transcriptional regulator [Coleofasciculaceae cyanobacterium SM2_3_26]|nr:Fis family transcriptional regulator [Coleofasciculaceae cyanobacterium SM2_3_26]
MAEASLDFVGLDKAERERFELLSAYLDGEVTAAERRLVEDWLASDLQVRRWKHQLIVLRHRLERSPVPGSKQTVEQTIRQFFRQLDCQLRQRLLWGSAALATAWVGSMLGILPGASSHQFANFFNPVPHQEAVRVALNHPVVEIPKMAVEKKSEHEKDLER